MGIPRELKRKQFSIGRWRVDIAMNWPRFFWRWIVHRKIYYHPPISLRPQWFYNVRSDLYDRGIWLGPIVAIDQMTPSRFEKP